MIRFPVLLCLLPVVVLRCHAIGSFIFGKWCPWNAWSPCNTFGGMQVKEEGECHVKGIMKRNRTCECPKPKFERFLNRCPASRRAQERQCRIACVEEGSGVSIPSFYVFLIISVSIIVVVGLFTCLYSFLRICTRRHRLNRRACCPDMAASPPDSPPRRPPLPPDAHSDDEASPDDRPPDYSQVVSEDDAAAAAAKGRHTPPPAYYALFRHAHPPPDGCGSRDEPAEATPMLERRQQQQQATPDGDSGIA